MPVTDSLYGRIALAFALILLAFGLFVAVLLHTATRYHQDELIQKLSLGLAKHIGEQWPLTDPDGFNKTAIDQLFDMLMVVNPSIEVYLLDQDGGIRAHLAPPGRLQRDRVDLAPVRALLKGASLPVVGDDPRSKTGQQIFSVARLGPAEKTTGYLYIVLAGENYRRLSQDLWSGQVYRVAAFVGAAALLLAIGVGLVIFSWITRRLTKLTRQVAALAANDFVGEWNGDGVRSASEDEITQLCAVFAKMRDTISVQMRELLHQDKLRRELVANVSHDLRTPLTSLQGYLETLVIKADSLTAEDRQRYLGIAVRQSQKVARLAQELFELARLECEDITPNIEPFSLAELIQDVLQKFELTAARKDIALHPPENYALPAVAGDIGLIERVLTNLIDNALRHTPRSGAVHIDLRYRRGAVEVVVADTGCGIPVEKLAKLFDRQSPLERRPTYSSGGLGLIICQTILKLHGSLIHVQSGQGSGARFSFALPAA